MCCVAIGEMRKKNPLQVEYVPRSDQGENQEADEHTLTALGLGGGRVQVEQGR